MYGAIYTLCRLQAYGQPFNATMPTYIHATHAWEQGRGYIGIIVNKAPHAWGGGSFPRKCIVYSSHKILSFMQLVVYSTNMFVWTSFDFSVLTMSYYYSQPREGKRYYIYLPACSQTGAQITTMHAH